MMNKRMTFAAGLTLTAALVGSAWTTPAAAQASDDISLVGTGGLCIDVPSANNENGQDLWIWDCNGTPAQRFTYESTKMELRVMGKCLDIEGTERSLSDVQITQCGYTGDLNWYGTSAGEIRTERFPGLCLGVRGNASERRAALEVAHCDGSPAQRWRTIRPASAPKPTQSRTASTSASAIKMLLDEIAEGEGTGDATAQRMGYASGYDVPLGYGRFTRDLPKSLRKPISSMSIAEVRRLQDIIRPRSGMNSSAVGKYQIVGRTLDSLQRSMGFSNAAVFDAELQDQLAIQLLKQRGLTSFQNGRLSASAFQKNLAKEWASIAVDHRDRGYYDGQNSHRAATTNDEIDVALSRLR